MKINEFFIFFLKNWKNFISSVLMLLNCLIKRYEWIYVFILWNWYVVDEIKIIFNEKILFIKLKSNK